MTSLETELITSLDQDVRRRQYYPRDPRRMADVVSHLFARRGYARVLGNEDYQQAWQVIVGDALGNDTRVGNLRGGVLQIVAANSTVVQELSFRKHLILARLKEEFANQRIRDVRFIVGPVK